MSDPSQPDKGPMNPLPAAIQPIPLREPQQHVARLPAWAKFLQFVLGIGIGSLPLPVVILTGNLGVALVLYFALLVLSVILMVHQTYRFIGFGMLAMILAAPVIVVQMCFVSLAGPQGYLLPAPPPHTHVVPTFPISFRQR